MRGGAAGWNAGLVMRRGAGSNMNSTSFCSAFLKLNLASSKGWATWSMRNSVGRFLDSRPSLH